MNITKIDIHIYEHVMHNIPNLFGGHTDGIKKKTLMEIFSLLSKLPTQVSVQLVQRLNGSMAIHVNSTRMSKHTVCI